MRLRQRFAAVRQRLDEGGMDEARKAACETRLTGLDPDSWVGEEEVIRERAAGFDGAIEEIRRLLGLPRRRTRRVTRREDQAAAAPRPEETSATED